MDRDRDRAADARAGAEGDVDRAEDLLVLEDVAGQLRAVVGPDAELGQVGALLAGAGEQLVEALALGPGRLRQVPALDGQVRGVALDEADGGQRARRDRPLSAQRRDEALAAREVAERARRGEVAVVGDALAAREVQAQVGAPRAGDVGLVGLGEQVGDRPAASGRGRRSRRP